MPAGGCANIDFYGRACQRDDLELVILLGEGTFHQVHGGVTTNAALDDDLSQYFEEYKRIRGEPYRIVPKTAHYLGHVPFEAREFVQQSANRAAFCPTNSK